MMIDEYQRPHDGYRDGMLAITVKAWKGFADTVDHFRPYTNHYVWRGQRQGWPLKSSFDRFWGTRAGCRKEGLKRHFDNFRGKMKRSHPQISLALVGDDIVWALGQHHNLKSPILDWTRDPYIAAYFAFEEVAIADDDGFRYVYGLSRTIRRLMVKWKRGATLQRKERASRTEGLPQDLLPLFSSQEAVFTRTERGRSIEDTVRAWSEKRPGQIALVKIRIPEGERGRCFTELERMKIDYKKLLLVLCDVTCACNCDLHKPDGTVAARGEAQLADC
jgi:hypothetical protein